MSAEVAEVGDSVKDLSLDPPIYTSETRGCDDFGEGTQKVPYKTISQAMRRYGKEPFPVIYQDAKQDSEAAKEGEIRIVIGITRIVGSVIFFVQLRGL
jgi:hypothetical protein